MFFHTIQQVCIPNNLIKFSFICFAMILAAYMKINDKVTSELQHKDKQVNLLSGQEKKENMQFFKVC